MCQSRRFVFGYRVDEQCRGCSTAAETASNARERLRALVNFIFLNWARLCANLVVTCDDTIHDYIQTTTPYPGVSGNLFVTS